MNILLPKKIKLFVLCLLVFWAACNSNEQQTKSVEKQFEKGTYGFDADFLKKNANEIIELTNKNDSSKILLSADHQGRVMTSTSRGDHGISYGWLNYDLIASKQKKKQFNPVGGEERFWLGPEGGQYSIYFQGGDSFDITHWQVPPIIDTIKYDARQLDNSHALFTKKATITNYGGTVFNISIERKISLLSKEELEIKLKNSIPSNIYFVGYETENRIQNVGENDWTNKKGLLSIWLLGMFTPSPQTVVIIPFQPLKDAQTFISDNYFGTIPPERLRVKDSVLFFTCDGKYRSKIGLAPAIAKPIAASFDFEKNIFTVILPEVHKTAPYVNSKWEIQSQPYSGDVINSYNDGPLEDGSQLGPFYELESSSPALELKKGQTGVYRQVTCHFEADYNTLQKFVKQLLGVNLDDVKK